MYLREAKKNLFSCNRTQPAESLAWLPGLQGLSKVRCKIRDGKFQQSRFGGACRVSRSSYKKDPAKFIEKQPRFANKLVFLWSPGIERGATTEKKVVLCLSDTALWTWGLEPPVI